MAGTERDKVCITRANTSKGYAWFQPKLRTGEPCVDTFLSFFFFFLVPSLNEECLGEAFQRIILNNLSKFMCHPTWIFFLF